MGHRVEIEEKAVDPAGIVLAVQALGLDEEANDRAAQALSIAKCSPQLAVSAASHARFLFAQPARDRYIALIVLAVRAKGLCL